jgi:orotate phosphoribosyltransferase
MVEDIVTTGVSSRECLAAIRQRAASPWRLLPDRPFRRQGQGRRETDRAGEWKVPAWEADKLPPHLQDSPGVKPGSRGLA